MFREKIKGVINERGLTIQKLSKMTRVNASSISSFLSGSRPLSNENLDALLSALDLTLVPKANFHYEKEEKKSEESGAE